MSDNKEDDHNEEAFAWVSSLYVETIPLFSNPFLLNSNITQIYFFGPVISNLTIYEIQNQHI